MNLLEPAFEERKDTPSVDEKFLSDVLEGLSKSLKTLPCKYFYDERGSRLFEQICELDEYYVTRSELEIMESSVHEMVQLVGPGADILEFGSGTGIKTRMLLKALDLPRSYTPMDISAEILLLTSEELEESFPGLRISPVLADYTDEFPFLELFSADRTGKKLVYFPGSTLGNFDRAEAAAFLSRVRVLLGPGGGLLIGLDLVKSEAVLNLAYDDPGGVTAEFNKNLLYRMNRELQADFDPDSFRHLANYNHALDRIEMFLVSERDQVVTIGGTPIPISAGEAIHTESSHKYTISGFSALAGERGFRVRANWTDEQDYFAVLYLEVGDEGPHGF
jgi:dimethylhistidine N-methyltransferase